MGYHHHSLISTTRVLLFSFCCKTTHEFDRSDHLFLKWIRLFWTAKSLVLRSLLQVCVWIRLMPKSKSSLFWVRSDMQSLEQSRLELGHNWGPVETVRTLKYLIFCKPWSSCWMVNLKELGHHFTPSLNTLNSYVIGNSGCLGIFTLDVFGILSFVFSFELLMGFDPSHLVWFYMPQIYWVPKPRENIRKILIAHEIIVRIGKKRNQMTLMWIKWMVGGIGITN